jgi:hypothetical protein
METRVFDRTSELRRFVSALAEWRDPVGVLSVTVGIEPGAARRGTPAWAIAVENDLARLREGASPALGRCLDDASIHLEELFDPVGGESGRALYVTLDAGAFRRLDLRTPLPSRARVGSVAHVLPLLHALEAGAPTGLVMVSKDQVVVLESELAELRELERIDLEPWVGDWWPEMKGPSRANPLRGQHSVSQRDRYSHRLAAAYDRTRRKASQALAGIAAERQWTLAVLAGDPRTVGVLEKAIRQGGVESISTLGTNLEGLRTEDAHARLAEMRESIVADVSLQRARAVRVPAVGSARACGLESVLLALAEARVASLVIDPERAYEGVVDADGTLRVSGNGVPAVELTDSIVARCLDTGAEVHPVHGAAADAVADCGGIAARLRW